MSCVDDRLADVHPHISTKHNKRKDWKGFIMIKHPVTKKEEPQNCINNCSNHDIKEGK